MTTDRVNPAGGAPVSGDMPRLPDPSSTMPDQSLAPPILTAPDPGQSLPPPTTHVESHGVGPQDWTLERMQAAHRETTHQMRMGRRDAASVRPIRVAPAAMIAVALVAVVCVVAVVR